MYYVNELGLSCFETLCGIMADSFRPAVNTAKCTQFKKLAGLRWTPLDIPYTHPIM